nr:MAG TPA: ATP-binding sugar transporter [Caudoviricetes sp.]
MSAFGELLDADIGSVFLNEEHWGRRVTVDGAEIVCAIDSAEGSRRAPETGVEADQIVLYARSADVEFARRRAGDMLEVAGKWWLVLYWKQDDGMAEIGLSRSE